MMTEPEGREPAVAAAVIVEDRCVLLVRRAVPEPGLDWQLPAGKLGPGESAEDAAVRETAEETGLTVLARTVLGERIHPATGKRMVYVACQVVDGEAFVRDQDEIAAIAWVTVGQASRFVPRGFYGPVRDYLNAHA